MSSIKGLNEVEVYAPATVANLNVGFDALGLALSNPGERMVIRKTESQGVVLILENGSDLPTDPLKNVAGKAAISALELLGNPFGVEIEVYKNIKPGSGIGSSAASAAAAVKGIEALVGVDLSELNKLKAALDGEEIASGSRHADNVAPALFGGICLITPDRKIHSLPIPDNLYLVILHPQIVIKTSESRAVLPKLVPISSAINQTAWMGGFVHSCYSNDLARFATSLQDLIVGPSRKNLLPEYDSCYSAAMEAGALAVGISGSGPSTFYVTSSEKKAIEIGQTLAKIMTSINLSHDIHISTVSKKGAHVLS